MHASADQGRSPKGPDGKTVTAVLQQIAAMGSACFEIGLFDPNAGAGASSMIPRVWDAHTIAKSIPWLRHQNRMGRNIYIRPEGEHDLSMVDDLTASGVSAAKEAGFAPAVVVETSKGNFQVWLKHSELLIKEVSTLAARTLAEKFGGDRGAADWRHFGRLAGFTNRKTKHLDGDTGLYPYVRLIEATGIVYPEAQSFVATVKADFERRNTERGHAKTRDFHGDRTPIQRGLKSIDDFRIDVRYGGDGTRVDLAFAVYALAHGISADQVANALRSRDLSHKGNERRQDDYVARTIKKALSALERGR